MNGRDEFLCALSGSSRPLRPGFWGSGGEKGTAVLEKYSLPSFRSQLLCADQAYPQQEAEKANFLHHGQVFCQAAIIIKDIIGNHHSEVEQSKVKKKAPAVPVQSNHGTECGQQAETGRNIDHQIVVKGR